MYSTRVCKVQLPAALETKTRARAITMVSDVALWWEAEKDGARGKRLREKATQSKSKEEDETS